MTDTRVPAPAPALPTWARLADIAWISLAAVAFIVDMSGGFLLRLGAVRLSVKNPVRLLVIAAIVALVRHLIDRRQPVYRYLPGVIARAAAATPTRTAALVLIGTRPAIFFAGYLAISVFGYAGGRNPLAFSDSELMNLPMRFDAGWYLQIAMGGYHYVRNAAASYQQNIVFFPALPILMRPVALLFGKHWFSYVLAGTVVSLGAFFAALAYLYRFSRERLSEEQSRTVLWMLAWYPFALFYGAIYTESLFLLAAIGAFFHLERRQYAIAALWAALAGFTRPNAFLLGLPLGVLAITPWLPGWLAGGDPRRRTVESSSAAVPPALAVAAAAGIGVVVFSLFIWQLTGRPLAWLEGHAAWGRNYEGLASVVTDRYKYISDNGMEGYVTSLPHDVLNALGVLFVLAAAWPVARRLGLAYAVFILINILPPLAAGQLLSAGRFSSVLFPAFVWFAGAVPERHRPAWLGTFAAIQALDAAMFYTWRPLF